MPFAAERFIQLDELFFELYLDELLLDVKTDHQPTTYVVSVPMGGLAADDLHFRMNSAHSSASLTLIYVNKISKIQTLFVNLSFYLNIKVFTLQNVIKYIALNSLISRKYPS